MKWFIIYQVNNTNMTNRLWVFFRNLTFLSYNKFLLNYLLIVCDFDLKKIDRNKDKENYFLHQCWQDHGGIHSILFSILLLNFFSMSITCYLFCFYIGIYCYVLLFDEKETLYIKHWECFAYRKFISAYS